MFIFQNFHTPREGDTPSHTLPPRARVTQPWCPQWKPTFYATVWLLPDQVVSCPGFLTWSKPPLSYTCHREHRNNTGILLFQGRVVYYNWNITFSTLVMWVKVTTSSLICFNWMATLSITGSMLNSSALWIDFFLLTMFHYPPTTSIASYLAQTM